MTRQLTATLFNDPGCPFGYSASPVLRTLEWRYRDQISWQLVTIGLSDPENPSSFSPADQAGAWVDFRDRFGMPFTVEPKRRPFTTARSCQAIVAARRLHPGSEWRVLRMLQLLHFTTPLLLDEDEDLHAALTAVRGVDADAVMAALDSPGNFSAYREDWQRARQAAGGPADAQGRTADTPGGSRYTAPSIVFSTGQQSAEVGGFQPVEAYDAVIANLAPDLARVAPAEDPLDALKLYPDGLTTRELAAIRCGNLDDPARDPVEQDLIRLADAGRVRRVPMGHDALWVSA